MARRASSSLDRSGRPVLKFVLGSVVFLASLYLMHQVLVATGIATPTVAMLFRENS